MSGPVYHPSCLAGTSLLAIPLSVAPPMLGVWGSSGAAEGAGSAAAGGGSSSSAASGTSGRSKEDLTLGVVGKARPPRPQTSACCCPHLGRACSCIHGTTCSRICSRSHKPCECMYVLPCVCLCVVRWPVHQGPHPDGEGNREPASHDAHLQARGGGEARRWVDACLIDLRILSLSS